VHDELTDGTGLRHRVDHVRAGTRLACAVSMSVLVLVLMGAGASLLAVLVLLKAGTGMASAARTQAIVWSLSAPATSSSRHGPLEFPGRHDLPDYLDFAFGMTAQTSDVAIRGRRIGRTALMHGGIAWVSNTAVVALLISVLSSVVGE